MMKILFDLRQYEVSLKRGIGRYMHSLIDSILKNYPEIEISIIKHNENETPTFSYNNDKVKYYYYDKLETYKFENKFDYLFVDDFLSLYSYKGFKIKDINNFFEDLFNQKILANSKRIVCIGHDLVPVLFKAYDKLNYNKYYLQLETASIFEHIFTNSETTKKDFIKYLNIDKDKLTTIYGGADYKFINTNKNYLYSFRNNSIVFISSIDDVRKNIKKLISGFSIAYNKKEIPNDAKLYLCGIYISEETKKDIEFFIEKNNLTKKQIIITGYISDEQLIKLICNSKANFLPSLYEGLGLTILEAYACGTPSFASNVSSMKELVLEECSFDPYDENDIANAIVKAFNDEELCKKSVEFGKKLLEEKCNFDIVSKKVVEKLKELNKTVIMDKAIFMEYNDIKLFSYTNSHIFSTIHHYSDMESVNNSLADLKKIIKKYHRNNYKIIENINDINEIFNLLIENKIYGFKILFSKQM